MALAVSARRVAESEAERWLDKAEEWSRLQQNQCWANAALRRNLVDYACQEEGPFECKLGLCPQHCEEVH
jgi:hypothetical protein